MTWKDICDRARDHIKPNCRACPVCDGRACGNNVAGPGAKGYGDVAIRNFKAWKRVRINMDPLVAAAPIDMTFNLFGQSLEYPIFAGPISDVALHYGPLYDDTKYNRVLMEGCCDAGTRAFLGDSVDVHGFAIAMSALKETDGAGIPTIKPWDITILQEKFAASREAGAFAIAMDIDAGGLPFLKGRTPPAGCKSEKELAEIVQAAQLPFIVKGIMTPNAAEKAVRAGAKAVLVSNHGGRVLDGCPSSAEVLPAIAKQVAGRAVVLVDGGIRCGVDVFRALALGADAVVIARPYITAAYGAGREGVAFLTRKIGEELKDTMELCGARKLADISRDMIFCDGIGAASFYEQ